MRLSKLSNQASEKEYKLSDPTSEVIFHAYPQSPVAEKFGLPLASKDLRGARWKFRAYHPNQC